MGVVPGDELGGRVGAGQVLPRDPQPVVGGRPERVDDAVVALQQLLAADVPAQLHPAEEAKARLARRLGVALGDRLDLGMVGRHARAHQPERGGQGVEDVHLEALPEQLLGGIEAGRPGADDRDACHAARIIASRPLGGPG